MTDAANTVPDTPGPAAAVDPEAGPGSTTAPPGMALHDGLGFRLVRLARAIRAGWAEELGSVGLTPPQAAILRGIRDVPGCSLRALARTLGTDTMHVKRCADELEQRHLLRSAHRAGDRRPRTLTLTGSGQDLVDRVDGLVASQQARFETALDPMLRPAFDQALTCLELAFDLPPAPAAIAAVSATSPSLPSRNPNP